MSVRRVVPDIKSQHLDESRAFYVDFLGLKVGMDMGFIVTFVSPSNPTAQIRTVVALLGFRVGVGLIGAAV